MKNLNELFEYAMWVVEECGIETGTITNVKVNTRAKKRYGQCTYRGLTGTYEINISSFILADDTDENAVMETIIHEILHTCKGCMNHGKEWKRLANIVYQKSGYRITTTSTREKFGLESIPTKAKNNYVFVCEDCGQVIRRDRFSKFCQHYHDYRCGKCGGKFRFDSENSNRQILTVNPRLRAVAELADTFSHE